MARKLIGTAVTDENGEATITYTGTGAGQVNIVAESGAFLTKIYEVEDCYWWEIGNSLTEYQKSQGGLTLENGVFTFTKWNTSDAMFYTDFPKTDYPITDLQGKTITVKAEVTSKSVNGGSLAFYQYDGSTWSSPIIKTFTSLGTVTNTVNVNSNTTQIRLRFNIFGDADKVLVIEKLRMLFD